MTQEDNKNEGDLLWKNFSEVVPEREDVIYPKDNDEETPIGEERQTLTSRMKTNPNQSEIQTIIEQAFPDLGYAYLNNLQMSRQFPDSYIPMESILVKQLLKDNPKLSVGEAKAIVATAMSIAIDGEGRIDLLGFAGVQAKQAEIEEQKRNLM